MSIHNGRTGLAQALNIQPKEKDGAAIVIFSEVMDAFHLHIP